MANGLEEKEGVGSYGIETFPVSMSAARLSECLFAAAFTECRAR